MKSQSLKQPARKKSNLLIHHDAIEPWLKLKYRWLRKIGKKNLLRCEAVLYRLRTFWPRQSSLFITYFVAKGTEESYRYRIGNIIEGLSKYDVCAEVLYEDQLYKLNYLRSTTDILVVFRLNYSECIGFIIEYFKRNKIPVVFDIDDYIFEPELVQYWGGAADLSEGERQNRASWALGYKKVLQICDFATATTKFLVERLEKYKKNSYLIRNSINESQFRLACKLPFPREAGSVVKISYFSGSNTHQRDFEQANEALREILRRYNNVELHVVGYLDIDKELGQFRERVKKVQFMDYLKMLEYLSGMDINIAPLELNNPFNDSKSELKIFEAALVHVPSIVSGVDSYARCIVNGHNGYLANSKEEWIECLSLLINDKTLRNRIGNQANKDFMPIFDVAEVAKQALNIYKDIIWKFSING